MSTPRQTRDAPGPEYVARSACYLCGHALDLEPGGDDFVVRIPDYESSLGEFDVVKCRRCALGHTNPYPTAETAGVLYSTKQSADFDVITGSVIDQIKDRLARRLAARLGRETVVRSVLDFSTGNGRFAFAAAEVFPDAKVPSTFRTNRRRPSRAKVGFSTSPWTRSRRALRTTTSSSSVRCWSTPMTPLLSSPVSGRISPPAASFISRYRT